MKIVGSFVVLGAGWLWEHTHMGVAGNVLVKALSSADDNTKTIAGMSIVRGGEDSLPLIQKARDRRSADPDVLSRLESAIAGEEDNESLIGLTQSDDPEVAKAARRLLASRGWTEDA